MGTYLTYQSLESHKRIMEHLFIFSLMGTSVLSYSSGPPSSTCSSLTPGHSGITYNENSANLKIDILDASKGLINVAINSQKIFKGFIIQARDDNGSPIGTFLTGFYKKMECSGSNGNTISHTSATNKNSVVSRWRAPNGYKGIITFRATVVYNYSSGQKIQKSIQL